MSPSTNLVYRKNARVLQRYSPELFRDLEATALPLDRQLAPAQNGEPTLIAITGGKEIALHSRYDPRREAVTWARGVDENADMVVVLGMGLGYHLEALKDLYPHKAVLVLEPELAAVKLAFAARDMTHLLKSGQFYLLAVADPEDAAAQLSNILAENAGKRIALHTLPAYEQLYAGYWQRVCQGVTDRLRQRRVNWATTEKFMMQWLCNFRDNFLPYIKAPGVIHLFDAFSGKPALIVAAGPSLEKNIHLLPSLKGRVLIMAAGSAIRILEKNGIKPDLLVSFDPGDANYQHFAGFDGRGVPLVYAPVIFPRIVQEYQGPTFSCELNVSPFIEWFDEKLGEKKGVLISGPSVANVCLDLAVKMGANPIILIGQDLAFTNNKTHADGARHQQRIDPSQGNYIWVEDIYGDRVPTTTAFYSMLVWYEQYLGNLKGKRLVIDATEGGARIRSTEIMSLQEVRDKYLRETFSPGEIIAAKHDVYAVPDGEQLRRLEEAFSELSSRREDLRACFEEGIEVARQLLEKCHKKTVKLTNYERARRKFMGLDRRITGNILYRLFLEQGLAARIDAINRILGERVNDEQELPARGEKLASLYLSFFTEVERYAEFTTEILKEIEEKIRRESASTSCSKA
ncbi:hypothetical protein MTHERMOG20_20620 [Moorella thermoacetica]|uniref:DUF115 domain-containing protein n=1 Tax=Moorella thermoacetica (strain ATCC 39073 / JCM 9320) TaxID=264732 RepID=Q2RKF9_MOOTA|nr:6-hydroxymethylpterin diphosphokinase MptE-like protein [Moorella thermoacetica]AKX93510.1 hypothetical protein MOTHE_c07060 [Moorella thermoacetica]AKX96157.1 hypothetical protein MOTHA_c08000 [Moorella thermoacetica]OIQ55369.1 hypothetical protein MOCA_19410 [Moorella thermoacetica]QCZ99967.1 hypothetical protein MothHH_00814 [Moorella thermoacetica]TYL07379.1 hypothetical protein MOOCA_21440 [Moorella thermoacetica]